VGFLDLVSRAASAADTAIAVNRATRKESREALRWAQHEVRIGEMYYALDGSGKHWRFVKKDKLLQEPVTKLGVRATHVYREHGSAGFAVGRRPGNWWSVEEYAAAHKYWEGDPLDDGALDEWLKDPDVVFDAAAYRELRKGSWQFGRDIIGDLRDFA
jgi:hypothetical protein